MIFVIAECGVADHYLGAEFPFSGSFHPRRTILPRPIFSCSKELILKRISKRPIPRASLGEQFPGTTPTILFGIRGGESRMTREMRRPVVGVVKALLVLRENNRRTPGPSVEKICTKALRVFGSHQRI